jgi:pilus assembly protein TadC
MALLSGLLAGSALLLLLHRPSAWRLRDVAAAPRSDGAGALVALPTALPSRLPTLLRGPVLACAAAGAAVALLIPFPVGLISGAALALCGPRLLDRLEPQAVREERLRLLADLPLVLDLLAACLAGGAPLPEAVHAVAAAVGGPAGRRLDTVVSMLGVGAPPADAWAALAGTDLEDPLAPVARALARAADGGAPVAASVGRLAVDARAAARASGEQAARRVGVLVVAPLGLCFLPAFVLLGVVPVVVGLAAPLLAP